MVEYRALRASEEEEAIGLWGRALANTPVAQGRVYLPCEPAVDAAVDGLLARVQAGEWAVAMARPLAERFTEAEIDATFAAPGAICWPADDF